MKKIFIIASIYMGLLFNASAYVFDQNIQKEILNIEKIMYVQNDDLFENAISEVESKISAADLPDQEFYALKVNLLLAKLNMTSDKQEQKKIVLEMKLLHEQADDYYRNNSDFSECFLTSLADLKSRLVNYVSGGSMYKISMEASKIYQQAIKINNKYASAYSGYGNWFYFAPAVAGGGYKEALKQFNKAVTNSSDPIERYINLIYRSQTHQKLGNKKQCNQDLTSAHQIFPEEKMTDQIRILNEKGKCFFD